MKRLVFLSLFLMCLATGYGQVGKTKQTTRLPFDSVAVQSSGKGRDAQVIDGSQNMQTRSGGKSVQLQLPARIDRDSVAEVNSASTGQANTNQHPPAPFKGGTYNSQFSILNSQFKNEPQSVVIERERNRTQLRSSIVLSHEEATFAFFRETPQLKIPLPELQIRIDTIETDNLNITHVKGMQLHRNIPVYGMYFTFHISASSELFMGCTVDTTYIHSLDTRFSAADAVRITEHDLSQTTVIRKPNEFMKKTMNYVQPAVEAIYYPTSSDGYSYCYKVVIRPNFRDEWIYYIDAATGNVVDKYNNTPYDGPNTGSGRDLGGTTRTVNTYLENGTHYMVNAAKPMFSAKDFSGVIGVFDAKNDRRIHSDQGMEVSFATSSSSTWNHPTAVSTMYHCSLVYDYLRNTHKRNSFDGKGTSMMAYINVCDPEDYLGMENAFWNGSVIALGNGRNVFNPLAGGLDVIAHEFGHAVISTTAKLEYRNQSGAINETFADIFGAMVDRANWTIGEAVVKNKSYFNTGFLRDMSNPHNGGGNGWQPAHVSEMYLGTEDNGGVHINSGIGNYAYYLYATATSKERAEQVYFRALDKYLTPTSKFSDLRKAVIQAAKDLNFSADVQTIGNAFDKVGIVDDTSAPPPPVDIPTNPGGWGLLLCNTDASDRNSLYKTTDYKSFTPLTQTVMYSTPSITDDGKSAIFVDNKNNIRLIDMTTGKESVINNEGDNQSVAISRDGKRLAVVTTYEDGRIYVYDFNTTKWMVFKLYNPTTGTGGAKSSGPRYADAIEFDHTGENIIYDAYNVVGSSIGGRTVEYWDIGLINVWNNSRNTWGSGEVAKLFSDLSAGVNVMNPVFSKNSPHIIAFDYYDADDGNFTIGVNLASGDVIPMFSNNMPSYPNYRMDDKHIAFTTMDRSYHTGYFNLGNNKISVTGDPALIASGAAFPIYYGTGSRVLGAKPVASFTVDTRSGGAPLVVQFVDMSDNKPTSWRWTFTGGSPSSSTQQHPKVTYNTTGTYAVTLVATNSYGSGELVRQGYITVGTTGTEVVLQEPITVYPVPASDVVWITGASDKVQQVKVFDLTGKAFPVTFAIEQNKIRVDVSRLPQGVYFLHVVEADGKTQTQKLVKN